jgi:hypothetical protein
MRRTFMALGQHGRLGNQLWQIAATVGQARHEGYDVKFPAWRYAPYFSVPPSLFGATEPGDVDDGFVHQQEMHYFAGYEDLIREWFSPSPTTIDALVDKYPWFFEHGPEDLCALHVRRGDAIGKEQWHPIQPTSYHRQAMDIMLERNPHMIFLVFSDGIDWCRKHLPNSCVFVSPPEIQSTATVENDVDHEELFLMSLCDHHIISNSTFSWWGAWVAGDEQVVYPSQWFGPMYPELTANLHKNLIPNGWIEVPS